MPGLDFLLPELESLKRAGWYRELRSVVSMEGAKALVDGKEVLILSSNNYLGLTFHPEVLEASRRALQEFGAGSTGSRLTTGNFTLHESLEERLASFKGAEKALVFSSGYLANLGAITALVKRRDLILSDEINHASIKDGCRLSGANTLEYRHGDIEHLTELLAENRSLYQRTLIVTDTVFSMDGDLAPLKEIVDLAKKYDAMIMVDEAHATGVFGKKGSGLVEELGLEGQIHVRMGTLSKAVGSVGGYVAGSTELIQWLINRSRPFIYDTSLPPSAVGASLKALEIIESDTSLRSRLWDNINRFKTGLQDLGVKLLPTSSAICCIQVGDIEKTMAFSSRLLEQGVWAPAIRPPTVKNSRIRFTLMATHASEEIDRALAAIERTIKDTL